MAESFFLNLRDNYEDSHRSEEMGLLAEIWCKREKQGEAKELLLECLRKLVAESKSATGSDKRFFESCFQNQRGTLLMLFPSESQAMLVASGIPGSTPNGSATRRCQNCESARSTQGPDRALHLALFE
ncbi:MAG: hypothetical protein JJE04_20930 [Acidobacteriia bacterium]|nr:hypothetical protein [Terriglobia bacterium]